MGSPRTQPLAADPCTVDSRHYHVEFEDEKVRIVRVRYGPHEKSVMHGHPESVAIFLTDLDVRFTYPDGRTEDIRTKAGETLRMAAFQHLPENLSDKPMEVVLIEMKI